MSQAEAPLQSQASVRGLHAGTLFWKVSLATGMGDWIVNRRRRGTHLRAWGIIRSWSPVVDNRDTVPLRASEEPSGMHLRIVYQHLSTSSYPLWLRGSPWGVNCVGLPDSTPWVPPRPPTSILCWKSRDAPGQKTVQVHSPGWSRQLP